MITIKNYNNHTDKYNNATHIDFPIDMCHKNMEYLHLKNNKQNTIIIPSVVASFFVVFWSRDGKFFQFFFFLIYHIPCFKLSKHIYYTICINYFGMSTY